MSECSNLDMMLRTLGRKEPQVTRTAAGVGTSHSLGPTLNPVSVPSRPVNPAHALVSLPYLVTGTIAMTWLSRLLTFPLGPSILSPHQPITARSCQFCILHIFLDQAPRAAILDYRSSLLTGLPASSLLSSCNQCSSNANLSLSFPPLLKSSRASKAFKMKPKCLNFPTIWLWPTTPALPPAISGYTEL